jgi:hypothetical protein
MRYLALAGLTMLSTQALATASLDCVAKPYYLSVIVGFEHDDPQQFSFFDDSGQVAGGEINLWKEFHLKWPNGVGPKGNSLKFRGEFPNNLSIRGTVNGEVGTLVVNGKKHVLKCHWEK